MRLNTHQRGVVAPMAGAALAWVAILLLPSLSLGQPSPCGGYQLWPEYRVNQDSSEGRQVEVSLAKNPLTSKNMVVVAMDHRIDTTNSVGPRAWAYTTMNEGQTWTEFEFQTNFLPPQGGEFKSADPSGAFGSMNRVYAIVNWIHYFPMLADTPKFAGVYLYRSLDGGLTWGFMTAIAPIQYVWPWVGYTPFVFDEKPMIAVKPGAGPGGNDLVYVAWTRQNNNQGTCPPTPPGPCVSYAEIRFSGSTDSGATFSPPVTVSGLAANHQWNAMPAAGTGNRVYVTWMRITGGCQGTIYIRRSDDGGATWNVFGGDNAVTPTPIWPTWNNVSIAQVTHRYPNLYGAGLGRAWTHPVVKAWPGPGGVDTVYVTWHDVDLHPCMGNPIPIPPTGTQIRLAVSTDSGQTWPPLATTINNDNPSTTNQFLPFMDLDANGNPLIAWYDCRNDTATNALYDIYYAGPSTSGANCLLTSINSDPRLLVDGIGLPYWFIGDYLGVAAGLDGSWGVAWADCRNARTLGHPLNRSADVYFRNLLPEGVLIEGAVSGGTGGSVPLVFQAGSRYGGAGYRILGTRSREVGFRWGERWVPLDRDTFYDLVEAGRNGPMFQGFEDVLDGVGRGVAGFTIPPGGTFPTGTYHFVLVTADGAYMSGIRTVRVVP